MFRGRLVANLLVFTGVLLAQPAKTTIQDTIYKADGSVFSGTAVVTWNSFEAGDTSNIGMQSLSVPIVNGVLYVQLAPTTTAKPAKPYHVLYHSDGKVQFAEDWSVPVSVKALRVRDVRVSSLTSTTNGGGTATGGGGGTTTGGGGTTTPPNQTPVLETDVVGLSADLTLRPVKGPGYTPGRSAVVNGAGELESVVGDPGDCVRVDGTPNPCFDPNNLATFVDAESPAGTMDGTNVTFTLANAPSPGVSLSLFRNGIYQKAGVDFALNGNTIQFALKSTPQAGDSLMASYRTGGTGGGAVRQISTNFPLTGGGLLSGDLSLSLADAAFLRRGHKAMVIGDSMAGGFYPDAPFPTIPDNWFAQAVVGSRSAIRYLGNAGLLGDPSNDVLSRLNRDVISKNPDKVFIVTGYSDIYYLTPVATVIGNLNAMINALKAANILPILCTIPPRVPEDLTGNSSQASVTNGVLLNVQMRKLADSQGIPLVDFYSLLVDPQTGQYRSGYSQDAHHPSMPASRLMAQAAIAATKDIFDPTYPWLPTTVTDPANLLLDSLFMQTPSKWTSAIASGSVALQTTLTLDSSIVGNTMQLVKTDAASVNTFTGATITSGFQPGDRLAFTGRIKSSGCEAGGLHFDISLLFNPGGSRSYPFYGWSVDIQDGQWYVEITVPAGATSMTPVIQLNTGTGTLNLGQIGVMNLTQFGL